MSVRIRTEDDRKYHPAGAMEDLENCVLHLQLARKHGIPVTYEFKKRMEWLVGNVNMYLYAIKIEEPPPVLNYVI